MALLDHTDLEKQKNIELTDPNGRELANKLANSILSWAERRLGYPLRSGTKTEYFDGGTKRLYLGNGVNITNVAVSLWDGSTYQPYTGSVRTSGNVIELGSTPASGLNRVEVTYEAGYSEADFRTTDLHQALTELLALKFDSAQTSCAKPSGSSS